MRLCVVEFKECWQDERGAWLSSGGFPAQMDALRTLCDEMTIVIVRSPAREGGIPLPADARVVPLRSPVGVDLRRKISVGARLPYYLSRIAREVRAADMVHAPVPGDLPYLGLLLAVLKRKHLFALYNASWTPNSETTVMNRITRQTMRILARGRDVMLALGPVDATSVPAPGMHWVFVSIITEAEVAAIVPDYARPPHQPLRLAYVGRLSVEKGVLHLLEAMHVLKSDADLAGTIPHVTLIGDGPQRSELESVVSRLELGGKVQFAGQLNRGDVLRRLFEIDVCVLPSRSEGFCKARLDAMVCGVPVLTTDTGFGREIVGSDGERGWVVPPGDSLSLANAMRRILSDPVDWPALRRRCRAYAEQQTIERWSADIAAICAQRWNWELHDGQLRRPRA